VHKFKYKSDSSIKWNKARLVSKGYSKKVGVDHATTYSLVVNNDSIRVGLAIAISHKIDIHQFNINIVFLNGDLLEEIYMAQTKGYVQPKATKLVCRF
jgi:hypothetical protein